MDELQGDFFITGGEDFKKKLAELLDRAGDDLVVRVGFLEGSTCGQDNASSAPNVAALLEYGTINMPPRPFFQQMLDKNSGKWKNRIVNLAKRYKSDMGLTMKALGETVAQDLVMEIIAFDDPPDSEETIRRKGFKGGASATLQDSKNLLRAVSYEVNGEEFKPTVSA